MSQLLINFYFHFVLEMAQLNIMQLGLLLFFKKKWNKEVVCIAHKIDGVLTLAV